jgi:transposase-like protein
MKSRTKPALRVLPPAEVQISLPVQGVLRDVQHAFLGLCIDAGQKVLAALMEADRVALCGAKGVPDAARQATRGGSTRSQVVLGGQRIAVRRPRARSLDEGELSLPSFQWAARADPLDAATMAAIAAGVSTRRYASTQEPVPEAHRPSAASKSAVSRRFVQLSQEQLAHWLARSIGQLDLPVVMIDGIHFRDRVILLAIGIDAQGNKHVLGLREGSTEAARVVASLLSDLIDRGLDAQRMRLWVIDGGKALRKAIVQTFGACALIQRCQEHKRRNVLEHLPEDMHAGVKRALRDAWSASHADQARRQLRRLAGSPARGTGGDGDGAGSGHQRRAVPDAAHDQPHREPERIGGALLPQCQALGRWSDGAALGGQRPQRRCRPHAQAARLLADAQPAQGAECASS